MRGPVMSNLAKAILRCLPSNGRGISRAELRVRLTGDEWVSRNPHRLGRLDSTLAMMAELGLLHLTADQVIAVEQTDR